MCMNYYAVWDDIERCGFSDKDTGLFYVCGRFVEYDEAYCDMQEGFTVVKNMNVTWTHPNGPFRKNDKLKESTFTTWTK